ncbi:hypothetical protein LCGC14_2012670 [marine sediment metagenome]|uniref:LTXXQ motif family protein n=2 Tax=root TaxID=1 RepID=A0A831QNC6_9FLAO|nr:hypothetical protein [Pricia antarctica]
MKKVIVVLLCLVGMTAVAQKGEKHERNLKNDLTPEQMATLKTKEMTLALDLTETQQKQIQTLNVESAKTRKVKMEERRASKKNDQLKRPTSDERYATKNEFLDRMIAQKAEMKDILSPEQYEKWEKMAQRNGKHRNGKGKKGDGQRRHTRK